MRSNTSLYGRNLLWIASGMLDILTKILRRIFNQNLCITKKNWEKFGGYRYYSYICNHKSKINKDFYEKAEEVVCEYRLFFLYDHRILDGCFWGQPEGWMFWSSEDRVRARFHYAESRQNKPQVNLLGKSCLRYCFARNIIIIGI